MPSNADLLVDAIRGKRQVTAYYDGYYREMCPHVIGWKRSAHHVLSFQFGGDSSRGLPAGGEWKCMNVDGLSNLTLRDGPWMTGPGHSRPQTCVDRVEVEVSF